LVWSAVVVWMDPAKRSQSSTALGASGGRVAPAARQSPSATPEVGSPCLEHARAAAAADGKHAHASFFRCVVARRFFKAWSHGYWQKRISPQSPPGTPGVRLLIYRLSALRFLFFFFVVPGQEPSSNAKQGAQPASELATARFGARRGAERGGAAHSVCQG
jgi:hypothetical protein